MTSIFKNAFGTTIGALVAIVGVTTIFWCIPLVKRLCRRPARRLLDEMMRLERTAADRVLRAVEGNGYFNAVSAQFGGAIAVNPQNRKVAFVAGRMQPRGAVSVEEFVVDANELTDWSASKPGLTIETPNSRADSIEMLRSHRANANAIAASMRETGLRIYTSSLKHPEVLLNFDFETTKGWVLVLDKLRAGTLESPKQSTLYPFVKP